MGGVQCRLGAGLLGTLAMRSYAANVLFAAVVLTTLKVCTLMHVTVKHSTFTLCSEQLRVAAMLLKILLRFFCGVAGCS